MVYPVSTAPVLTEASRVFRLYIKSLGYKTVYRGEESVKMRSSIGDALRVVRYY
jgi:hypothetical protein